MLFLINRGFFSLAEYRHFQFTSPCSDPFMAFSLSDWPGKSRWQSEIRLALSSFNRLSMHPYYMIFGLLNAFYLQSTIKLVNRLFLCINPAEYVTTGFRLHASNQQWKIRHKNLTSVINSFV